MHAYICYRFYNYKQQKGQLLVIYIAKLCHLAATCEWTEAQLAENICNKFMMGLQNECLLQQLLSQDHKKALEELLELADTFEAAEHESLKHANDDHSKKESDTGTVAATGNNHDPVNPSSLLIASELLRLGSNPSASLQAMCQLLRPTLKKHSPFLLCYM